MKPAAGILLFLLFTSIAFTQNLQSPDEFLGYKLGERYTPHYKIVNYFNYAAATAPQQVKVEQYGYTYEGRPLLLAFVSSPENLGKLDDIRQNNLRLAHSADGVAGNENGIVVVWLSYNVHGNEPASSEAAMKTLFSLASSQNSSTKEWLKNTVVIIDPCLNPDGRDRYVNWFNSVKSKLPDPDPQGREHDEPWPDGRTNHYNFDLNRDWAWQSQIETQQRLKKYNQWLPQVHVDFHEQSINYPYYFAPAAEPYHEVITGWQRSFQNMIAKNNAKYFDQNGWLYFTRQTFDLFYPSYGDTYPTFNGAIGMTYEQAGLGRAGLAVTTRGGDTLTLKDRIEHHFTTSLSTIEVSSQNAQRLQKEFHKYFNDAVHSPAGQFKAYIIQADGGDRLESMTNLLERNSIEWSYILTGDNKNLILNGLNYASGKFENFQVTDGDIVINCNQPRSNLIRVLFERTSKLTDSATYDITAWSLPFAYGLKTYGLVNYYTGGKKKLEKKVPAQLQPAYAYAIKWTGINSAKILSALLRKGVRVRYMEQPFTERNKIFDKGTLLVTKASNMHIPDLQEVLTNAVTNSNVEIGSIESGLVEKGFDLGSDKVRIIKPPKVILLTGSGTYSSSAGEVWHFFEQELEYPLTLINAEDFPRINLKDVDVIIMPSGNYRFLTDKTSSDQLKNWVQQGGKLIAIEGAVGQLSHMDWGIKSKISDEPTDKKEDEYDALKRYENRERDPLNKSIPGTIYKVDLDNSHPLAFGYSGTYYTLRQNDNIYEFFKKDGWNVGVIKKDYYISGFAGMLVRKKLMDGLLFGVQDLGNGNIVYLSDDVLFRSFWENGKLLFCNAVFLVGQ